MRKLGPFSKVCGHISGSWEEEYQGPSALSAGTCLPCSIGRRLTSMPACNTGAWSHLNCIHLGGSDLQPACAVLKWHKLQQQKADTNVPQSCASVNPQRDPRLLWPLIGYSPSSSFPPKTLSHPQVSPEAEVMSH